LDVQPRDKYGRLLAYVYVGNIMMNAALMRLGFAQAATFPHHVKYQDHFLTLQREAREAKRGLWRQ
jgi:micrococcal nuclease